MIRLRIREIIEERKINRSKLSRIADVPLNTIQLLYHNPYHDPRISTLERIAEALKVDISELYEIVPNRDKRE